MFRFIITHNKRHWPRHQLPYYRVHTECEIGVDQYVEVMSVRFHSFWFFKTDHRVPEINFQ